MMPRDLKASAFPTLAECYAKEAKTVIGFTVYQPGEPGGYESAPKLDVRWIWTADANGGSH